VSGGLFGRHRKLLFRSYLFLAAGLLLVAALLDFGFGYLQSSLDPGDELWLESSAALIELQLQNVPPDELEGAAAGLSQTLGFPVKLLGRDEIAVESGSVNGFKRLVDEDDNQFFLLDLPSIERVVYVGPVVPERESFLPRLLPPVFYLSILVIVGVWLRPLLKDLNLITASAQRFAADYREPLSTAEQAGQLTELASHLDDMSERVSGLIQNQKELIAALSHEMRTPLARIRFALAVIANESNGTSGENARLTEQLNGLANDVQEIDQLIATMLSYARLDHPDLQMNWQSVPIRSWIDEIREKVHDPAGRLSVQIDDDIDTAPMDPRLMSLGVSNLLNNASRYASREVICKIAADHGEFRIEVHDDGEGIPSEERASVFKAFKRLDDSRNRDTGGYGLGLAIVARIAALHGGSVDVSGSEKLGGACFVLRWRDLSPPDQSAEIIVNPLGPKA
jgi:signal transduction histidine kinase